MMLYLGVHDRPRFRSMFVPAGLVLFVVVAFTWFGVVIAQQPGRLGYFLGYEVYDRVFTAVHDRNSQWYGAFEVYLPMLIVGTLPWSLLAVVAAGGPAAAWRTFRARLRERNRDWLLLTYWLLLPLAIFFLARSRLQLYVLPLFVPLALMMARALPGWRLPVDRRIAWTAGITALPRWSRSRVCWRTGTRTGMRAISRRRSRRSCRDVRSTASCSSACARYYGLNVYLDTPIEGIQIGEHRFEYSKYLSAGQTCAPRSATRAGRLRDQGSSAAKSSTRRSRHAMRRRRQSARFIADGNNIGFFTVGPSTR